MGQLKESQVEVERLKEQLEGRPREVFEPRKADGTCERDEIRVHFAC